MSDASPMTRLYPLSDGVQVTIDKTENSTHYIVTLTVTLPVELLLNGYSLYVKVGR